MIIIICIIIAVLLFVFLEKKEINNHHKVINYKTKAEREKEAQEYDNNYVDEDTEKSILEKYSENIGIEFNDATYEQLIKGNISYDIKKVTWHDYNDVKSTFIQNGQLMESDPDKKIAAGKIDKLPVLLICCVRPEVLKVEAFSIKKKTSQKAVQIFEKSYNDYVKDSEKNHNKS